MTRSIGKCRNCGDDAHPKGNVFRVMSAIFYELDFGSDRLADITTDHVKVCNNCDTPHPFYPRVSAKAKARKELFDRLLAEAA